MMEFWSKPRFNFIELIAFIALHAAIRHAFGL